MVMPPMPSDANEKMRALRASAHSTAMPLRLAIRERRQREIDARPQMFVHRAALAGRLWPRCPVRPGMWQPEQVSKPGPGLANRLAWYSWNVRSSGHAMRRHHVVTAAAQALRSRPVAIVKGGVPSGVRTAR